MYTIQLVREPKKQLGTGMVMLSIVRERVVVMVK